MPYSDVMQTSLKITAKGQITLKQDLMKHLGAQPGDRIDVEMLSGGALRLVPPRRKSWSDLVGLLHRPGEKAVTIEEMNQAIGDAVVAGYERSR